VTVADFTGAGPEIDEQMVEHALVPIRQRGQVRFQYPEDYSPGLPGRQIDITLPNGRQHRASAYMADHRLYITETYAAPGEFAALQFEQSVLLLDGNGGDLNNANPAARNKYPCEARPAVAETAGDLVRQAIAAVGGADALRALNGVFGKGRGQVLGTGTIVLGRPRAAFPRRCELHDHVEFGDRNGAHGMGPRSTISASGDEVEIYRDADADDRFRHRCERRSADVGYSHRGTAARTGARLAASAAQGDG
jgi:hypothetical protein